MLAFCSMENLVGSFINRLIELHSKAYLLIICYLAMYVSFLSRECEWECVISVAQQHIRKLKHTAMGMPQGLRGSLSPSNKVNLQNAIEEKKQENVQVVTQTFIFTQEKCFIQLPVAVGKANMHRKAD